MSQGASTSRSQVQNGHFVVEVWHEAIGTLVVLRFQVCMLSFYCGDCSSPERVALQEELALTGNAVNSVLARKHIYSRPLCFVCCACVGESLHALNQSPLFTASQAVVGLLLAL